MGGFPLIHSLGAALVDHPLGIGEDHILMWDAHRFDELDARNRRCTGAVADEFDAFEVAAGDRQRIDEAGGSDDRGAVLIVMEDRNVHELAQAVLYDEAVRRLDVLKIDATECGAEIADRADELIDVARIDLEIDRIDIGKPLEENRFAFHASS